MELSRALIVDTGGTIHQLTLMTYLLRQALEKATSLPAARQDEPARLLLAAIGSDSSRLTLTAAQVAEVEARLASADETASLDDVRAELASWAK